MLLIFFKKKNSEEKESYIGIYFISLSRANSLLASSGFLCKAVVCFYCFRVVYGMTSPRCICYSSDGHLGCLHCPALVNSTSVGTACVLGGQSAILCCICRKRKLLGCWVSVSLTSPALSNSILDSYLTHHHWCPTSPADFDMVVRVQLSHSGPCIWDHIVVLVCVSVLVSHMKQQPMCLFAFCECL